MKTDAQIAAEISGIKNLQTSDGKIDAAELKQVLNSLNDNKHGGNIFILSQKGILNDATLTDGSTSFGTDQTTQIQAILDLAQTRPIWIIWDVKTSVTGLIVKGNTKITALPGCGAILRNNSDQTMFANETPIYTYGSYDFDYFILEGDGIWNFNGVNNSGTFLQSRDDVSDLVEGPTVGIRMFGVKNVIIKGGEFLRPRLFAFFLANMKYVSVTDGYINVSTYGEINMDGIHICGPVDKVVIDNMRIYSLDDAIAINADEATVGKAFYEGSMYGQIKDIHINNITLLGGRFGIRILSGDSRVENVHIRNIKGTNTNYAVVIDNLYADPTSIVDAGNGNVGTVTIDNVQVECTSFDTGTYKPGKIQVGCNVENLILKNLIRNDFSIAGISMVYLHNNKTINKLLLDGYSCYDTSSNVTKHIVIEAGSTVKRFDITNVDIERTGANNNSYVIDVAGTVTKLMLHNVKTNNCNNTVKISTGGSIGSVVLNNIYNSGGASVLNIPTAITVADVDANSIYATAVKDGAGTITKQRGYAFQAGQLP